MKNILFFFTLFICFSSCQDAPKKASKKLTNQEIQADTIVFFEDFVEEKLCISRTQDTLCATGSALVIRVENGPNTSASKKISLSLQREVSGDSLTVSEYLNSFIASVNYFLEEENEYWPAYFDIDVIQDIALNNNLLMTGTTHQHMEEGGAHGNYFSQNFNFDVNTGENLDWHELFMDTLQVYKLAEKILRQDLKEQEYGVGVDLHEFYDFPAGKFYLPNNFLIDTHSFNFLYTLYELGPYALGETEIILPFEEIKLLVKKETVLNDFLKTKNL